MGDVEAPVEEEIKCVVIGDPVVGKTTMLSVYSNNVFPKDYVATVFDNFSTNIKVRDRQLKMGLWDTAGQDDYERIRPMTYHDTHVFIIVFSVVSPNSLDNVFQRWVPEVKRHSEDTPFILVGNKIDLREDEKTIEDLKASKQAPVPSSQVEKLKNKTGAKAVLECSALTQKGLSNVFQTAAEIAIIQDKKNEKKTKKRTCTIL